MIDHADLAKLRHVRGRLEREAAKEILREATDLTAQLDRLSIGLQSPRRTPWQQILSLLPDADRITAEQDDAAAERVLNAFGEARRQVTSEIDRLWRRTFGAGIEPTEGQRLAFVRSESVLSMLEAREAQLRGQSVRTTAWGWDTARLSGRQFLAQAQAAMSRQFPALGRTRIAVTTTPPPGPVEEFYLGRALDDARQIAQDTRHQAHEVLVSEALTGHGIPQMQRRLNQVFEGNGTRAELTARYAVLKSSNVGRMRHYQAMNEVLQPYGRTVRKVWLTTVDDRTCPICLGLNGTVVSLDESFDVTATFGTSPAPPTWPVGGELLTPPRHARCRCTLIPIVSGATTDNEDQSIPNQLRQAARARAQALGYVPRAVAVGAAVTVGAAATAGGVYLGYKTVHALRDVKFRGVAESFMANVTQRARRMREFLRDLSARQAADEQPFKPEQLFLFEPPEPLPGEITVEPPVTGLPPYVPLAEDVLPSGYVPHEGTAPAEVKAWLLEHIDLGTLEEAMGWPRNEDALELLLLELGLRDVRELEELDPETLVRRLRNPRVIPPEKLREIERRFRAEPPDDEGLPPFLGPAARMPRRPRRPGGAP